MYIQKFNKQLIKQAIQLNYNYCNFYSGFKYPDITNKEIQNEYNKLTAEQRDNLVLTYFG